MLFAVLSNNFNNTFQNSLSENDQKEFKEIMSIKDDELKTKINELKENILSKVENLINESKNNNELYEKLIGVKHEVNQMCETKYNLYKLKQLKNGLN